MIENERYDAVFLGATNPAAAGETSWTNTSLLVVIKDGKPGALVRASDVVVDGAPLGRGSQRP